MGFREIVIEKDRFCFYFIEVVNAFSFGVVGKDRLIEGLGKK